MDELAYEDRVEGGIGPLAMFAVGPIIMGIMMLIGIILLGVGISQLTSWNIGNGLTLIVVGGGMMYIGAVVGGAFGGGGGGGGGLVGKLTGIFK